MTRILGGRSAASDLAAADPATTTRPHGNEAMNNPHLALAFEGACYLAGRWICFSRNSTGVCSPSAPARIADFENAGDADFVTAFLDRFRVLGAVVRVAFIFQSVVAVAGAEPNGRVIAR